MTSKCLVFVVQATKMLNLTRNVFVSFRVDRVVKGLVKQDQQPHNTVPILVRDLEVVLLQLVTTVHNQAEVSHKVEQRRMDIKVMEPTDKPLPMDSSSMTGSIKSGISNVLLLVSSCTQKQVNNRVITNEHFPLVMCCRLVTIDRVFSSMFT